MIELYAITDHPGPPLPDLTRLRSVASGRLAGVCAQAGSDEVTPDALWRHEEVVETLMEDRDLLPVRWGSRFDDEEAAAQELAERQEELAAALDRVRGAVELSLRVLVADDPPPPNQQELGGAEYMRLKACTAAEREEAARIIHDPLSLLARRSRRMRPRSPSELLRAAYLVDRPAIQSFVGLVEREESAHPSLRMLCTGPWPPYSFVER